jgi:arylsulfatase A-like enzyme
VNSPARHTRTAVRHLALAVLIVVSATNCLSASGRPPNIVFIIADDMYVDMLNCTPEGKGRNLTPHLDRLAVGGVRLEHHYVFPTGSPTRCALLSGRNSARFGILGPCTACLAMSGYGTGPIRPGMRLARARAARPARLRPTNSV